MSHDLLFETARFNRTKVGAHFINPCCFGEDVAAWLRARLAEHGVTAGEPGQEDWGWYLGAEHAGRAYFIGIGADADGEGEASDHGEWRIIIEKRRSLGERLTGGGRMAGDDAVLLLVRRILEAEPGFANVRRDA